MDRCNTARGPTLLGSPRDRCCSETIDVDLRGSHNLSTYHALNNFTYEQVDEPESWGQEPQHQV